MGTPRLVSLALVTCLVAGCSGGNAKDPEPSAPATSDPPSPSHSDPDASPIDDGSTAPTPPDAAREDTLDGAEAFVRHYIDLLNYASGSGDTEALKSASSPGCGGCYDYVALYKRTYRDGGFFKRGDWVAQNQVLKQRYAGTVRVVATVDSAPGIYRARKSSRSKTYGSNQYSLTFIIEHRSGQWTVREFDGSET